jgi:2-dehydro-3-deoxyphosphogluconate aldolase/(4S)-4-hydroxy-2-oxoglutarate aldolase
MERFLEKRLIPAAAVERPADAIPLAEAVLAGGLDVLEITFRTDAALEAIRRITGRFPEMLVGAGTVLNTEQLDRLMDAGGRFAVAPGLDEDVAARALANSLPMIPGVMTPSEVERALRCGCTLLKFFPAEASGGTGMLKAMAGPFRHTGVQFIPTGGIDAANMRSYLDLPIVAAVGGSWMVARDLVSAGNWPEITRRTAEAVAIASSGSGGDAVT